MIKISRSSSKLGQVGLKTRSLGPILEKSCVHSKRHSFDPKFMKVWQSVNLGNIESKTRSLHQILENHCVHSRQNTFDSKLTDLYQNVNDQNILGQV